VHLIEILTQASLVDSFTAAAEQAGAEVLTRSEGADGHAALKILVTSRDPQPLLDTLQRLTTEDSSTRMIVTVPELVLPRPKNDENSPSRSHATTREELYAQIEQDAKVDSVFLVLVLLSTVVAALGLLNDNVAVIIGAMMIAPLLGPNLSLALGVALGDAVLLRGAIAANAIGVTLTVGTGFVIGVAWPDTLMSHELLLRTDVGLDSVVLALAAGAAAVLSLTTRLPTVLVGVVVAAAFLPPATTIGLMAGAHNWSLAIGATTLLAANIVCVSLAAQIVFLIRGVRPRTWLEKTRAKQSVAVNLIIWVLMLAGLVAAIVMSDPL
jgi:uncharacterized hydrophobic protein (TIGR00341 family)